MGKVGEVVFETMGRKNSTPPPDPNLLTKESMFVGEVEVYKILKEVHPTLDSEEKRRDIINFIQGLIKIRFDCEVCPYGSVPLKTFLPDGDIDMIVLMGPDTQETFVNDVLALLQDEEQHSTPGYELKDIQFIDAEVKIIKFHVHDTAVDLSFNQLGGLSSLCFLEQVDRIIGHNHIFKTSIMLVKAWCYFESRMLAAHHGLLSTYAVEVLVLYIFQMFHSTLSGLLGVLYKFLEYYSQFDWENYCISLKGPVSISTLPILTFKMPEREWSNRMLNDEFLESCIDVFSVHSKEIEEKPKAFQMNFLNIIDPLNEYNNLGRSVHKGNFYRIRSALKYGACRLGQILLEPEEKIVGGACEFFSVTISRHGQQHTLQFHNLANRFGDEESFEEFVSLDERLYEEDVLLESPDKDYDSHNMGGECVSYRTSSNASYSAEAVTISHKMDFSSWIENKRMQGTTNSPHEWSMRDYSAICGTTLDSPHLRSDVYENQFQDFSETKSTSFGESVASKSLTDLAGDYDCNIRNLLYGILGMQWRMSS